MPAPAVHYRLSLGEYDGSESFIIQSKKGIDWSNVPPKLENLLAKLSVNELLDFSLGDSGTWYVKYRLQGVEKRKLSTGLWDTIGQDHTHTIDRLFLGGRGTFWGVIDIPDDGLEEFSGGGVSRLSRYFNTSAQGASYQALLQDSSKYIVPGHAGPTFAIKDSQGVRLKGTRKALTDVLTSVGDHTVNSIVLSASDSKHWLLILEDGNVEYSLPQSVLDVVLPYCKPQHSLMMSKKKARQKQGQDVTTLQLVEGGSEYASVRNLFSKGWKHPHKRPLPNIEKIYSVTLPPNLQKRYLDYRSTVASRCNGLQHTERLLFHGTQRQCDNYLSKKKKTPCNSTQCRLCMILRTSFKVGRAGSAPNRAFLRFGAGIYTSSVSSKADDYVANDTETEFRVMLLAKVVTGKVHKVWRTDQSMTAPQHPYDSVSGEVGVDLNYDEQVVYRDDAIIPAYLVVYNTKH